MTKVRVFKYLLLVVLLLLPSVRLTGAYFYTARELNDSILSSGYWSVDSSISTGRLDDGSYLGWITTQPLISMDYSVSPSSYQGQVKLCYSYNLQAFVCPDSLRSSSGQFTFDFPSGEGLYLFDTISFDNSHDLETKSFSLDPDGIYTRYFSVQYDSQPPTTNVRIDYTPAFNGQNMLKDGDFSNSILGWQTSSPTANFSVLSNDINIGQTITSPTNSPMAKLSGSSWFYQTVTLPVQQALDLSFWFRMISPDPVDFDRFKVMIKKGDGSAHETVLETGSREYVLTETSWVTDSGWQRLVHPLYDWAGQTVDLWFGVTDVGGSHTPTVYLDDIQIGTAGTAIGDTDTFSIQSHDTSSGLVLATTTPDLTVGDNSIPASTTDISGQAETTEVTQIQVLPSVVLDKIEVGTSQFVEIYNNSNTLVNLDGWQITNALGQVLSIGPSSVSSHTSLFISCPAAFTINQDEDIISLFSGARHADQFTLRRLDQSGTLWQRSPSGVGPWTLVSPAITYNLSYRPQSFRLLLSAANLPVGFGTDPTDRIDYVITYPVDGKGFDQITGQLLPGSVENHHIDREFYFGTCSQDVCTNSAVPIHPQVKLEITGSLGGSAIPAFTKTYNF